jgi:hypothetical protein
MIHLTADDKLLLKDLSLFYEPVEISDANGKLVGVFVPANLERGKEIYARAAERADRAEIERRARTEKSGRTTQEVLGRLTAPQSGAPSAPVPDGAPAGSSLPAPSEPT